MTLDETQRQGLTTVYDGDRRTLAFCRDTAGEAWLQLRVSGSPTAEEGYIWLYEPTEERTGCMARFDETQLTPDAVRYMVTRLDS